MVLCYKYVPEPVEVDGIGAFDKESSSVTGLKSTTSSARVLNIIVHFNLGLNCDSE